MPNVSTLLSGGVSVGILAGVVSGLFYLVVAGIRWAGEVKLQSGEWFYKQVQRRFHPAAIEHNKNNCDDGVGMDSECVQVREFIERLVESLVSGGLDDVCVKRLHSHPEYKPMPEQESPSTAHSALKQLVHQIIREAMTLPTLQGLNENAGQENGLHTEDMTSKTYEDILATAILNKVIERYQKTGALDGNSNLLARNMEQQPKFISRLEIGVKSPDSFQDENLNNSSLQYDSNLDSDPMSLTIEECIEEVTTFSNTEEEDSHLDKSGDAELNFYLPGLDFIQHHRVPFPEFGMDIVHGPPLVDLSDHDDGDDEEPYADDSSSPQPTDLISPVDSWEENWLFQRRRLKGAGAAQPMPVPMLVPNPSEDYRALIGDRDAEEISDLSDCSDGALEDLVLAEEEGDPHIVTEQQCSQVSQDEDQNSEIKIQVLESEHVEPTEEYESMSDERLELLEAKNVELYKSSSVDCLSEFGQQDSEYTEDYATITQRQMDSLSGASEPELPRTPAPKASPQGELTEQSTLLELDEKLQEEDTNRTQVTTELAMPPRPGTDQSDDEYCTLPCTGTIAEREHKKWESAPPLLNNPYSPENIGKRLSKRNHYISRSSSSEASVEFPEFKNEPVVATIIEKPLHIVCAPSELDCKRYQRDYYINSKTVSNESRPQLPPTSVNTTHSSLQPAQTQENSKPDYEIPPVSSERIHRPGTKEITEENKNGTQVSHLVESEVARLQKEINQSEQWYKNLLSSKVDSSNSISENNKTNKNSESSQDLHKFTKVIVNDTIDGNETKSPYTKKQNVVEKHQQIPREDSQHETIYGKTSFKQIKFPAYQEQRKSPEMHIGTRNGDEKYNARKQPVDENYIEACLNGSGRSDSPSEGSVISSDSEFSNLPSVKELTKRFSSMADSDSSTSTPKCPSPAPRWKVPDKPPEPAERTVAITGRPIMQSNLSPNRPVREVHSLTARSISREFREDLRRNQPLLLDRNVYNQSGTYMSLTTSSNGESSSTPSSTSDERETPPPMPTSIMPRSMRSNIAFWEQMQQDKS